MAEHEGDHWCNEGGRPNVGVRLTVLAPPCLPYRLAKAASDLAGKVAYYENSTTRWSIAGTWLVEETGQHNCGTGPGGHYEAHEPMCGYEPVVDLATLQGFATLADRSKP